MRVFLDDVLLSENAPDTLEAALDAGRDRARSLGRVIVEVWADGARVQDADLSPPVSVPGAFADEVRLVSAVPARLVAETLREAARALAAARDAQRAAAERIQRGRPEEAMPELTSALTVWDGVQRALQDGGLILGRRLEDQAPMPDLLRSLIERLGVLGASMQRKDWSGAADELLYELDDLAARWAAGLESLAARL